MFYAFYTFYTSVRACRHGHGHGQCISTLRVFRDEYFIKKAKAMTGATLR